MKKIKLFSLIVSLSISFGAFAQKQINVSDFGVTPQAKDCTKGIIDCLESVQNEDNVVIVFPRGVYNFYPDFGKDKYYFISNNDEGLKRIVFPLENFSNITIDGQGSSFIFHGFTNPFIVDKSSNITFKNFTVDYSRTFHSEAIILANNEDGIDVEIPEAFPFRINNGILVFTGNDKEEERQTTVSRNLSYPYGSLLEFDTEKRETAYMVYDYYLGGTPLPAKSIGERKVRIFHDKLKGTIGNTMVFSPNHRNYPGFILTDSKDINFENIIVNHAGGMGIVGQRTHNVVVESCKFTPSTGRIISCTADATHFVNCTGKIILNNCLFENQMDDATNIHGIYVQIAQKLSPNEMVVQLVHGQQYGFDFLVPGKVIELLKGRSMITKGTAKVIESKRINKNLTYIKIDNNIHADIVEGDAIGELRDFPFIHISNNIIRRNRARGMLLNCRGKTIVENNYFHSPGAALLFEGDARYWFEQGGVSDCTIRNNTFDNCLFGVWGKSIIDFQPGIDEDMEKSRYNKNIKIYGNTFRTFDKALLVQAYCVDGFTWENNKIEPNNDYPPHRNNESLFQVKFSDNVKIDQK